MSNLREVTTFLILFNFSSDQAMDRFAMKRFYDDKLSGILQPAQER